MSEDSFRDSPNHCDFFCGDVLSFRTDICELEFLLRVEWTLCLVLRFFTYMSTVMGPFLFGLVIAFLCNINYLLSVDC